MTESEDALRAALEAAGLSLQAIPEEQRAMFTSLSDDEVSRLITLCAGQAGAGGGTGGTGSDPVPPGSSGSSGSSGKDETGSEESSSGRDEPNTDGRRRSG